MDYGKRHQWALPWQASRNSDEGYAAVSQKSPSSPGVLNAAARGSRGIRFVLITALLISVSALARQALHGRPYSGTDLNLAPKADYYGEPGTLVIQRGSNVKKHEAARYVSMARAADILDRGQSALNPSLDLGDGWIDLQAMRNGQKLGHLVNKTVLLLGDSVDRYFVDHLCQQLLPGSRLSYHALHIPPADLSQIKNPNSHFDEFSEPHLCILPDQLGAAKIWSLMFYGVMTEDDNEWAFKDQTKSPRRVEDKLKLFSEALAKGGMRPPDLVITHSGLWDLATTNIRDVRANAPAAEILTLETVLTIRSRTIDLLAAVHLTWPRCRLMYRTTHAVKATVGDWFMRGIPLPPSGKPYANTPRVPMATSKVWQINAVIQSLFQEQETRPRNASQPAIPRFGLFDVAKVTQGYTGDFIDYVHLRDTGLALYAQMLLYYLKVNFQ